MAELVGEHGGERLGLDQAAAEDHGRAPDRGVRQRVVEDIEAGRPWQARAALRSSARASASSCGLFGGGAASAEPPPPHKAPTRGEGGRRSRGRSA